MDSELSEAELADMALQLVGSASVKVEQAELAVAVKQWLRGKIGPPVPELVAIPESVSGE